MCTSPKGSFNLTFLESRKCVVAIVQSVQGLCKSSVTVIALTC